MNLKKTESKLSEKEPYKMSIIELHKNYKIER